MKETRARTRPMGLASRVAAIAAGIVEASVRCPAMKAVETCRLNPARVAATTVTILAIVRHRPMASLARLVHPMARSNPGIPMPRVESVRAGISVTGIGAIKAAVKDLAAPQVGEKDRAVLQAGAGRAHRICRGCR